MQAYQTLRKGNKVFSVYDLTVTLDWTGCWKETDSQVPFRVIAIAELHGDLIGTVYACILGHDHVTVDKLLCCR
jgi:hypothetical protein